MSKPDADDAYGVPPSLLRGLTEERISRRQLVHRAGAGLAVVGMGSVLAACGVSGTKKSSTEESFDWTAWWGEQKKQGVLDLANWPLYIDGPKTARPNRSNSSKNRTGIKVNYRPVIQNNASFFAQISPSLQNGQWIGYDLIVFTNGWQLTQMIENGWLIPLDQARMPNFYKYASPDVEGPLLRPGQQVHRAVAVGHHRDRLQHRTRSTARSTASRTSSTPNSRARSG